MRAAFVLAAIAAALTACNDSSARAPAAPTTSPPPSAPRSGDALPAGTALPADQQCLPGNICERWAGCALVKQGPKWWTVIAADEFPAGEPVEVKNLCPGPQPCVAARGIPKGAACPPMTTPVLVKPPGYTCVWDGKTCSKR
jgi:hypothetical protein